MSLFGYLLDSAWKSSLIAGTIFAILLLTQSLRQFSRTGPQLKDEILGHYPGYLAWAISRLTFWAWLISCLTAGIGALPLISLAILFDFHPPLILMILTCGFGIVAISALQFCTHLLHIPGSIEASSNYQIRRFYPLWSILTPHRIKLAQKIMSLAVIGPLLSALIKLILLQEYVTTTILGAIAAIYTLLWLAVHPREARPVRSNGSCDLPNILMIGSDSLRADRLGLAGYHRNLTPTIDTLCNTGTYFSRCYVPCGRTATSLASLLTGCWPHIHGIRDNFVSDEEMELNVPTLPSLLKEAEYNTIAISDWAGADLGKLTFGFDRQELPEDQWNIKYLLRQGPKDLRLFLSLFTHNALGKRILPEIYYLAGIPLTSKLGRDARKAISDCASKEQPFFINIFTSTTHGPFGSEYPFYTMYTDPSYNGESKFVMSGLNDPFEIVRQQGKEAENFHLSQILDLYDGCVRNFDDEVSKILSHLDKCELSENTIVIIYSDHGMEFFERGSWGQGNSVIVDEGAHIPLVIYDPRNKKPRTVNHVIRSIDIAPTILSMVGLPLCQTMDGTSLLPYMADELGHPNLLAYMETGVWFTRVPGMHELHLSYPDLPELLEVADKSSGTISLKKNLYYHIINAKDRALRTDSWKLVRLPLQEGPLYYLFNLDSDPTCQHDVKDSYPIIFQELYNKLTKIIKMDPLFDPSTKSEG